MFLKSLTLKGFKSFADPATLQFEPGITVVVGPNGSGKSNVVDAVAWVLGAQGPRTVRSQKMEDVIFAGSADRPALGRAEVSLSIDNRAGRLPGGLAEITITRTLFRSGDSEYALNAQPCRLLDIQELLSDSGVGRQQHVIVGQGQLDNILNARPEDRRAVIEEAAGVLKHRRRRERAERRLQATEENLDRLGDLLRELRRQIRPLQKQAAAARSHAELAEELRALRLHLVGRELADLEERRRAGAEQLQQLQGREDASRRAMAELDVAADAAAAELSARRSEDLVAALTRVQALSERCRGLHAVLAERRRSLGRDLEVAADLDVVSTLEADAARLAAELDAVAAQDAGLEPRRAVLAAGERELVMSEAEYQAAFVDEGGLRQAGEALAVAQGQLAPLRGAIERDHLSLERLERRLSALDGRKGKLEEETANLAHQLEQLDAELAGAEPELEAAGRRAEAATRALERAEAAFLQAEAARHRLEARAEALARAAAEAAGSAGAETLSGRPGVRGLVGDLVEVDEGYAGAFEAALGPAAAAVVVEGEVAARQAMGRLEELEVSGALLPLPAFGPDSGGARGPAEGAGTPEPSRPWEANGCEALDRHVRAAPGAGALRHVLDRALAGVLVAPDWEHAVDTWLSQRSVVVVTRAGDRLSADGWVVGAGGARAAASAAADARQRAASAAARADAAAGAREAARRRAREQSAALAEASRRSERSSERRDAVRAARSRVTGEFDAVEEERAEALRHRTVVTERYERDAARLADLEDRLDGLGTAARQAEQRLAEARAARRQLEERRAALVASSRQLELQSAALAERRQVLGSRLADVERRLAGHVTERELAGERRRRIEADMAVVDRLGVTLESIATRLAAVLEHLQELRARQVDEVRAGGERLEELRRRRAHAEQELSAVRDRAQALQVEMAESSVRHEAAVEALRRELACD
ncbi:MAG TPA: AAA family ATPase, partial [Acidimicrobiales bacterium]|nr:AAA family ATPase [Acidimicrobiales bacterium]